MKTNADKYLKEGISVEEFMQSFKKKPLSEFTKKMPLNNALCLLTELEDFLNMECKATPKLTEDERVILRNIDKRWKNIYRNSGGGLELHEIYLGEEQMMIFYSYNHLFQFIKNGEGYSIKELLGDEK